MTSSSLIPHPSSLITEFTSFIETLADAAARATLPHFRLDPPVTDKGVSEFDPVTEADQEAEAAIRALIHATYPDHGVIGEEGGTEQGESPFTWVIDPIDGTRAFIAGLPLWTTLIALHDGTKPIIGLIDQPYLGERFLGTPSGAFLQTHGEMKVLSTRPHVRLSEAIFSTTTPQMFESPKDKRVHDAILEATRLVRYGCDAYAYAMLAAGHIDLVAEIGLKPWDVQALIPLVTAAGGAVASFEGGLADQGGRIVAAANPALLEEALALIARTA
jgi:myo-inositol-1(or 4)-monophosphatase